MKRQGRRERGRDRRARETGVPAPPTTCHSNAYVLPPPAPQSPAPALWGGRRRRQADGGNSKPRAVMNPANNFHRRLEAPKC